MTGCTVINPVPHLWIWPVWQQQKERRPVTFPTVRLKEPVAETALQIVRCVMEDRQSVADHLLQGGSYCPSCVMIPCCSRLCDQSRASSPLACALRYSSCFLLPETVTSFFPVHSSYVTLHPPLPFSVGISLVSFTLKYSHIFMSLLFEMGAHISFYTEDEQEMEESISGLKAGDMTICCVCFCARWGLARVIHPPVSVRSDTLIFNEVLFCWPRFGLSSV